ncbi:MAG: hypothetical protein HY836_11940 [Aquabacterium sp.]|uniref:hypothetical protein n=1 Tax=Aquabacterium sp. TaxID=1872578 RepID=UPI0025C2F0D8|nr:hypothetical protein [Aquabacterium sp.]MBI5926299.1 hypothetical protein [Aquabacterium sp.]
MLKMVSSIFKSTRIPQRFGVSAAMLTFASCACAIERSDVMVCGFEDGSEATLKATHDWSPVGALAGLIGDVSSRRNQSGYTAYFQAGNGKSSKAPRGAMFGIPIDQGKLVQSIGVRLCSEVAVWRGRPLVNGAFLADEGGWQDMAFSARRLPLHFEDMPGWVSAYLRKYDGWPARGGNFVAPVGDVLVSEQPIGDAKAKYVVSAVYQSISRDGGKTWDAPVLTPHAYIFEIGRVMVDQSFVGRPLTYEGQKFQAPKFTRPQTQEERNEAIQKLPVHWQRVISGSGTPGG